MPRSWSYRKVETLRVPETMRRGMPPAVVVFILMSIVLLGFSVAGVIYVLNHPVHAEDQGTMGGKPAPLLSRK